MSQVEDILRILNKIQINSGRYLPLSILTSCVELIVQVINVLQKQELNGKSIQTEDELETQNCIEDFTSRNSKRTVKGKQNLHPSSRDLIIHALRDTLVNEILKLDKFTCFKISTKYS